MVVSTFRDQHTIETRLSESTRIRSKYPERIPIILEQCPSSNIVPVVDRSKYLVPDHLTLGQFLVVIRQRIQLGSEHALFLFINQTLVPIGALLSTVYRDHHDPDGFLYVLYSGETTFGGRIL
jgi:GABA(A) receptor-associated protein